MATATHGVRGAMRRSKGNGCRGRIGGLRIWKNLFKRQFIQTLASFLRV